AGIRAGKLRRDRGMADDGCGAADRRVGGAVGWSEVQWAGGAAEGVVEPARRVCDHGDREAADLWAGTGRGGLRPTGDSADSAEGGAERLPLVVGHCGHCQERAISNAAEEERVMTFITKTSVPRRTLLRGLGAAIALPLLDSMVPALSKTAQAAAPVRRLG